MNEDTAPTPGELIDRWYRMGVEAATRGEPATGVYAAESIAHQWWSRGFQWAAANLRYHELRAQVQAALADPSGTAIRDLSEVIR